MPLLNFDWGSQSIAQSKFQRAPFSGERVSAETFESRPSILFPETFQIRGIGIAERTKPLASFRCLARRSPTDFNRREGRRCVLRWSPQVFFRRFPKKLSEKSPLKEPPSDVSDTRFSGRPRLKGRGTWNDSNCVQELSCARAPL